MPACSAQRSHSHSKVMDIFRTLGSGTLSVTAMLDFSGKTNTSIQGLREDETATISAAAASEVTSSKRPLFLLNLAPANTIRWPNVIWMFGQRHRRGTRIETTTGPCLVLAAAPTLPNPDLHHSETIRSSAWKISFPLFGNAWDSSIIDGAFVQCCWIFQFSGRVASPA